MNNPSPYDVIQQVLRRLPQPSIPADLVAAIKNETMLKKAWWESDTFRLRWMPAVVGVATALAVLWLSKFQVHPGPRAILPVASTWDTPKITQHAFLLPQDDEMSNSDKGERREHTKS